MLRPCGLRPSMNGTPEGGRTSEVFGAGHLKSTSVVYLRGTKTVPTWTLKTAGVGRNRVPTPKRGAHSTTGSMFFGFWGEWISAETIYVRSDSVKGLEG